MTSEAWQNVLSVIGGQYKERWPDEESRIIFLSTVFTYPERLTALTFLYGNLRDVDLVYSALLATPADRRRGARPGPRAPLPRRPSERQIRPQVLLFRRARRGLALPWRRGQHAPLAAQPVRARSACLGRRVHAHMARGGAVAYARRAARVPGSVDPGSAGPRSVVQ